MKNGKWIMENSGGFSLASAKISNNFQFLTFNFQFSGKEKI